MSWHHYVTHEQLEEALGKLNERITIMAANQQSDIDALTAAVGQVSTDLTSARSTLQSEIDALAAGNPTLDLSGLQAAVAPLDSAVNALGALTPTPPAPPAPVVPPPSA